MHSITPRRRRVRAASGVGAARRLVSGKSWWPEGVGGDLRAHFAPGTADDDGTTARVGWWWRTRARARGEGRGTGAHHRLASRNRSVHTDRCVALGQYNARSLAKLFFIA